MAMSEIISIAKAISLTRFREAWQDAKKHRTPNSSAKLLGGHTPEFGCEVLGETPPPPGVQKGFSSRKCLCVTSYSLFGGVGGGGFG